MLHEEAGQLVERDEIHAVVQVDMAGARYPDEFLWLVGDLTLAYESLQLPADPGLTLVTYSAEPGSATERALRELADWVGTRRRFAAVGTDVPA